MPKDKFFYFDFEISVNVRIYHLFPVFFEFLIVHIFELKSEDRNVIFVWDFIKASHKLPMINAEQRDFFPPYVLFFHCFNKNRIQLEMQVWF